MAKIQKSYRLEKKQVEQLDKLVEYYEAEMTNQLGVSVNISAATVLELLVKRDFERINGKEVNLDD